MINLNEDRVKYREYFNWFDGDLTSLWRVTGSLVNGLEFLEPRKDLLTRLNYFNASSKFYINAVMQNIPKELIPYLPMLNRMVKHWSVTGEYCLTIENGVVNTIRPDYVFPIRKDDNEDIITGFYFIFPIPKSTQKARVIEYNSITGLAFQNIRTFTGNQLEDVGGGEPVNIQAVIYEDSGNGYYKHIEGLVRELNVRFALMQFALNSTHIPILQIATEGMGGGLLSADGVTPLKVAGLGKSGLGLLIPPPFSGEEGARYVERQGTGLNEAVEYIRIILGALAIMSGVPEYVYGVSLTQSNAEVERIMFMGESRVNRMRDSLEYTFSRLGIDVDIPSVSLPKPSVEIVEGKSETND